MKNFLYKLIFPYCNKLYVGKAANDDRYGKNKPGDQFIGTHHNVEVQKLLQQGEFCFYHAIKEFDTDDEVKQAEQNYLHKVWATDEWKARPKWLLNRNRNSVGFASGKMNPVHQLTLEELQNNVKRMNTPSVRAVRDENYRITVSNLETHWNKGRSRPDIAAANQTPEKKQQLRKFMLKTKPCPHCGIEMNPGNLTQHIKRKHL